MRGHIRKIKNINDNARILGLDIGRKYVGVSMSDKKIQIARPFKTLVGDGQYNDDRLYNLHKNDDIFGALRKIIFSKNIKGLIIGYPLSEEGKPDLHCRFIERWIDHMWSLQIAKTVPVTLVNEYNSSM